jgi:hypothetical protein
MSGGPQLQTALGYFMNISSTRNTSETLTFEAHNPIIISFAYFVVNIDDPPSTKPTGMECALFPCAQTYRANVTQGRISQIVAKEWSHVTGNPIVEGSSLDDRASSASNLYENDLQILTPGLSTSTANPGSFNMSVCAFTALQNKLTAFFDGNAAGGMYGIGAVGYFSSDTVRRLNVVQIGQRCCRQLPSRSPRAFDATKHQLTWQGRI